MRKILCIAAGAVALPTIMGLLAWASIAIAGDYGLLLFVGVLVFGVLGGLIVSDLYND